MIVDKNSFEPGGALENWLPGYEFRPSQAQLAQAVEGCLARGDVGLFEAGTGTGKSLAYLIPAAAYALRRGKPVVISTQTISLQEQLLYKDIPTVQQMFPALRAVLVKGWGNYVCHWRLEEAMTQEATSLFPEHHDDLLRLYDWAQKTKEGTLADLPFVPNGEVWGDVNAESDTCLRAQCPFYRRCFFFEHRKAMADAHLLVVNHHLLFADIAIKRAVGWESDHGVLPNYGAVVIDEAHHVEDVATEHFGDTVSEMGVRQLLGRLPSRRGRAGLLQRWEAVAQAETQFDESFPPLLTAAFTDAELKVEAMFQSWHRARGSSEAGPDGKSVYRLTEGHLALWDADTGEATVDGYHALLQLSQRLAEAVEMLPKNDATDDDAAATSVKVSMNALVQRVQATAALIAEFRHPDLNQHVYWVESHRRRARQLRVTRAPIDVGNHLTSWMAGFGGGVVMVSATLALDGSFQYVKERLGLSGADEAASALSVKTSVFPSPFNYDDRTMLAVVTDLPEPNRSHYEEELVGTLETLIEASGGRALVLFTSHRLLQQTKARLTPVLARADIPVLAQGDGPRYKLLQRFREETRSVLFGAASFWEGVDVPGDALSLVVLTRLPFDVPTDPITQARMERVEERGMSPFWHYSLPRAALRLKQGFGRLLRSSHDRGAIVICDSRIVQKSYGSVLLQTLPVSGARTGSAADVAEEITALLHRTS